MSNSIMQQLRAESLLENQFVLTQVDKLKTALSYRSDAKVVSFDDHFIFLQENIDQIPRIKLRDKVDKGIASQYENELLNALAEIQDAIEKWKIKVIRFQGDLMRAKSDSDELRSAFESWYYLAALSVLQDAEIKLPANNIKNLATSEYSRLMDRSDVSIEALIEALKIEVKRLDGKRTMAKTMFDMGREQANSSWANLLPNALGIRGNAPNLGVLSSAVVDDDDDEVDLSYVSRSGKVKTIETSGAEGRVTEEDLNKEVTPTNTYCGICNAEQFLCPGGAGCPNGHGGAEQLDAPLASDVETEVQVVVEQLPEAFEEAAAPGVIERLIAKQEAGKSLGQGAAETPHTAVVVKEPSEIKGTFIKNGTPQPVTIVDDPEAEEDVDDNEEPDGDPDELDAGYHIELDPEADNEPDLTDVSDDEFSHMEDQLLEQVEAATVEPMSEAKKIVEISIIPKTAVVDPTVGFVDRTRFTTVDIPDDDFDIIPSSPVKEEVIVSPTVKKEVIVPTPLVEVPKPTNTPVTTRKPLNFDLDDDDLL